MFIAEREGFEPPVPLGTVVFKTTVIDHSTISPLRNFKNLCSLLVCDCKGRALFVIHQIKMRKNDDIFIK